jgi:hypothetical protein
MRIIYDIEGQLPAIMALKFLLSGREGLMLLLHGHLMT